MPTFPKAERLCSTPNQPVCIPVLSRGNSEQPKTTSVLNKTGEAAPHCGTPPPFPFEIRSSAGHTPHPSSVGRTLATVSDLQVQCGEEIHTN
jgi:hypothetical protein